MNKETAASDTGSAVKKSDLLKKELDALQAESVQVQLEIESCRRKLAMLEKRRNELLGGVFSHGCSEMEKKKKEMARALLNEFDETAIVVVWKKKPRWYDDEKWVVRKVTEKRIYVAVFGDASTIQYRRNGKSVSSDYAEIDIEATFGKSFEDKKGGLTA